MSAVAVFIYITYLLVFSGIALGLFFGLRLAKII